ncbi:MAG: glycosyltransferase family 4 protein [Herpetosiphonaceae bacterium]|nr:glycosyltransferase family 4 protein [Herpetosiphonaceae bacterium]
MKIGFLLDDHMHRPGGVQEYVRGMYRYLLRNGHEAVVFSGGTQFNTPLPERVIQLGISIPAKGSGSTTSLPVVLKSAAALRRLLREEACDVLHVQTPFSPTLSGRLLAVSEAAHVCSFHIRIDDPIRLRLLSWAARLQRPSFRHIHKRMAISQAAEETAQVLFPGRYERVGVGVHISRYAAAAQLPRLAEYNDDRVTIMTVGRLEERKGVAHLLRAYASLERAYGDAIRLVIAGDGPQREQLQALAAQLGLRSVQWLGFVENAALPQVMASADIFCAPATGQESFGYVLVEAMAAGLPIVGFANAGYAEVLAQHPGNFAVPVRDERALAGALSTFIASQPLRRAVSSRNRVGAERHSWTRVGAQVMQVYAEALEIRGSLAARR